MAASDLPQRDHIAELLRRGYGDEDIRKILGKNILRVMRAAEGVAASMIVLPGVKSSARMTSAKMPPSRKKNRTLKRYITPIRLWSSVVTESATLTRSRSPYCSSS